MSLDYGSGKALEQTMIAEIEQLGTALIENQRQIIEKLEKIEEVLANSEIEEEVSQGGKKRK